MKFVDFFLKSKTGANIVMLLIIGMGLLSLTRLQTETFPSSDMDMIRVTAKYDGASPAEVERNVLNLIEENCIGIKGFKSLSGSALEGRVEVVIELVEGTNRSNALLELKDRVEQINSFPDGVEEIITSEVKRKDRVVTIVLSGAVPERVLKFHGQRFKDSLIIKRLATEVVLEGTRGSEIQISLSDPLMRKHNLKITDVSSAVQKASLDLPLGSIHSSNSDLLLRIRQERRQPAEFLTIPVGYGVNGQEILLRDVAKVEKVFEELDIGAEFNGKKGIIVQVDKTEEQDTNVIAKKVTNYINEFRKTLPEEVEIQIFQDQSIQINDRLNILLDNGVKGLFLVFLVLWFFTRAHVAFWVSIGIPVSFLGTLFVMYFMGLTLNMITMFGLLLVLGMIVDDAIVVSENIYKRHQSGEPILLAASEGTKEVFWPILASSLTTLAAFVPLMFVSGKMGRTMGALPWVIASALLVSLIESFWCLPKHLEHATSQSEKKKPKTYPIRIAIESGFENLVEKNTAPIMGSVLSKRYLVFGGTIALLLVCGGLLLGGRLSFTFFPTPDTNSIVSRVRFPIGTPIEVTKGMVAEIEKGLVAVNHSLSDGEFPLVERVLIRLGETSIDTDKGGHLAQIQVELRDAELRSVTSDEVLAVWEKSTKIKPGVKSISFARLEKGVGGKELDIRLVGESWQQLEQASRSLMKELTQVAGVSNLETDLRPGKHELIVEVNPEGSRLGLTSANLAEQVRAAFLGVIVQRFQEEGEETVVRVIYQEQERQSIENLRNLTISIIGKEGRIIRTPLLQVATIQQEQGFSQLNHLDRQRAVAVTGEIDERITTAGKVMALLTPTLKEKIPKLFPGVMVRIEGQRATQRETFDSLLFGAGIGLMLILSILALVMDSWSGPFFILSIIPTGIIGMIFGHWVMGYNLTVLSIMAGVAMGGVVVNDSIIFMEFFVKERLSTDTEEALITTVKRRFRPILITTVTTVAGLLPMLMETSIQAQFLIPMAITLSFGLITGTIGTLVVLPSLIMIFDDIRS